jgi:hypothetical protein
VAVYTPATMDELQRVLAGCPEQMRVEIDIGIQVTALTVADLKTQISWPRRLAVMVPEEKRPDQVVKVMRAE